MLFARRLFLRSGRWLKVVRVYSGVLVRKLIKMYRKFHHHAARRPHNYLHEHLRWYRRWHGFRYRNHVHAVFLVVYCFGVGSLVFGVYRTAHALSDLTDTWNFTSGAAYTMDSGLETSGSSVRFKAQNYTTDGNTAALYHLDEPNGTSASDTSGNGHTGRFWAG